VDVQAFRTAVETWHDFYLAVGSAAAALLGLLFVGVSINLASLSGTERADIRTRANLAFSNLLYLLGLSLVVLVPGTDASFLSISFTSIAVLGLLRLARRIVALVRSGDGSWKRRDTIRRLAWTLLADLLLLYIARSIAVTNDAGWLMATPIVVLVLLLGAADVSWDLLVRESEEARPR
jgi:hypothetical protein